MGQHDVTSYHRTLKTNQSTNWSSSLFTIISESILCLIGVFISMYTIIRKKEGAGAANSLKVPLWRAHETYSTSVQVEQKSPLQKVSTIKYTSAGSHWNAKTQVNY